jgi:hypothetical protein
MQYNILLCLVKLLHIYSFTPLRICYIRNTKTYNSPEDGVLHKALNNQNILKFPVFNINNTNAGWDNRYNESDVDPDLFKRLKGNFEKYETLKYLRNDRISMLDKLQKIGESGINAPNLNAGGLTKDWDFNM